MAKAAALAIGAAFLAAMTAGAAAQSYESRGYGGPLYIGPNFQGGGQHSPPIYNPESSSKKRYKKTPVEREAKDPKARPTKEPETAARGAETDDAESENSSIAGGPAKAQDASGSGAVEAENSSISRAALEADAETQPDAADKTAQGEPKASRNVGCKKYFPSAGMTLSVPCD